jgi:NAD(P)-dependent dehydrogenase (short-subunit alcohol dehydrogenase family)
MTTCLIIGFVILLYVGYRVYQHFFPTPDIDPKGKYVLISGCDSGFGHGLALELDKQGFHVFAGVFLADSVTSLTNQLSSRATVFRLDITKEEEIEAAFVLVKEKTNVLHALVNNAGISAGYLIDWTSVETMRKVMDVNYFGHVAMTKKFLPLLIAKRDSRVVNICSVAGYLASAGMSSYCASKYALEAFSDCLRREMFPWDLRVSIIEPGFMRTPIIENLVKPYPEFLGALPGDVQERWGAEYLQGWHTKMEKRGLRKYADDPMKVIRALEHAVMNTAPQIRYRPGIQSSYIFFPLSTLPAWLVDRILRKLLQSTHIPASVHKQLKD